MKSINYPQSKDPNKTQKPLRESLFPPGQPDCFTSQLDQQEAPLSQLRPPWEKDPPTCPTSAEGWPFLTESPTFFPPFALSRSKLINFCNCSCLFYS